MHAVNSENILTPFKKTKFKQDYQNQQAFESIYFNHFGSFWCGSTNACICTAYSHFSSEITTKLEDNNLSQRPTKWAFPI